MLTNGWDHPSRELAAKTFNLDLKEMESRHRLTFDTFEIGKISLEEYLNRNVFYKKRSFSLKDFLDFMHAQSKPYPKMIELIRSCKEQRGLKVVAVSNEGRELTEYRIRKFKLDQFIDFFVSSCFVHLRKPDTEIFRIALDLAQTAPKEVVYIEDREMFVQVAETLGIKGLHHLDFESTSKKLSFILKS
jgi:putative hydrolase of the HAD superfamily